MTRDEALAKAASFVASKYPVTPPAVMAQHFMGPGPGLTVQVHSRSPGSTRWREVEVRLAERRGDIVPVVGATVGSECVCTWNAPASLAADASRLVGKWLVGFFMSWDTDAAGMPETLFVMVDDANGTVTDSIDE